MKPGIGSPQYLHLTIIPHNQIVYHSLQVYYYSLDGSMGGGSLQRYYHSPSHPRSMGRRHRTRQFRHRYLLQLTQRACKYRSRRNKTHLCSRHGSGRDTAVVLISEIQIRNQRAIQESNLVPLQTNRSLLHSCPARLHTRLLVATTGPATGTTTMTTLALDTGSRRTTTTKKTLRGSQSQSGPEKASARLCRRYRPKLLVLLRTTVYRNTY